MFGIIYDAGKRLEKERKKEKKEKKIGVDEEKIVNNDD